MFDLAPWKLVRMLAVTSIQQEQATGDEKGTEVS